LDKNAWEFLKSESEPHLTTGKPQGRGWEPLFNFLNQARGYVYLLDNSYSEIQFIPRSKISKQKTPDLQGNLNEDLVLLEVKTINRSKNEIKRMHLREAIEVQTELQGEFFTKLQETINTGKIQIDTFLKTVSKKCNIRIVFIVINFDDLLGEYKENYFKQIDNYLGENPAIGLEIVLFNQWTCFHKKVSLKNAIIVNEDF